MDCYYFNFTQYWHLPFYPIPPCFWGKPDANSLAKIHQSQAFDGEQFNNLEPTLKFTSDEDVSLLKWVWGFINPSKGKNPSEPLPTLALDQAKLINNDMVWSFNGTV